MPWTVAASYPEIVEAPAVASDGSYAYSAGGALSLIPTNGFYQYDPVADLWTALAPLPQALVDALAAYSANVNKIYVFGGLDAGIAVLNTTQIYDIATDTWSTGASMPDGRYFLNVVYSSNGKIYVIGGFDTNFGEASQTWEYDPVADKWDTSRTDIPVAMAGSATSIVGEYIYLAGSYGSGGTNLHYRYNISGNSWAAMAPVPVAVFAAAGAAVGSNTYLIGGGIPSFGPATRQARIAASMRAPAASYNSTYIYDTTTDSWTVGPNTNVAHYFTDGTAIGNRLIVVAGFDGSDDTKTVEIALTAGIPTPSPTPTPSATFTPTATPTATATATATATFTPTPTATATFTPTATPTPTPTPLVCVQLEGYWKNNPVQWPVTQLQLGNVTYNQQQLLSILREPVRGNGLVQLAGQTISAKLNIARGANRSCIQQTLTTADALIGNLVVPPVGNGNLPPRNVSALTQSLGDYNAGLLCAAGCR